MKPTGRRARELRMGWHLQAELRTGGSVRLRYCLQHGDQRLSHKLVVLDHQDTCQGVILHPPCRSLRGVRVAATSGSPGMLTSRSQGTSYILRGRKGPACNTAGNQGPHFEKVRKSTRKYEKAVRQHGGAAARSIQGRQAAAARGLLARPMGPLIARYTLPK